MARQIILDGGLIPTARVKNQTLIDTLLDDELISIVQHMAGEYVLAQCVKAGVYVKGMAYDGMPLGSGRHDTHYNGMLPLRKTLKLVRQKCGNSGADVLINAVVAEVLAARNLRLLKKSLGVVSEYRLTIRR